MKPDRSDCPEGVARRPIRVLHVITGLGTGGAETMLYRLISTIEGGEFSNAVVSLMDGGTFGPRLRELGVPLTCLGLGRGRAGPGALFRLRRAVREARPDVILAWMYHANIAASLAVLGRSGSVPVIWGVRRSLEGMEKEGRSTRLALSAGKFASFHPWRIAYNSQAAARQHESFGYPASKTVVIPNGLDTDRFRPAPELRAKIRAKLRIDDATPLVGIVGRYDAAKDHGNFLKAARILLDHHSAARFLLAGRETDTSPALRRLITDLDLQEKVHLLGEWQHVEELMCALDVLVSSSRTEGFPNTVGEAMSCGLPCVVTDVGDSAWLVENTGRVVPPSQAIALARGIDALLTAGPEARAHLGRAARQRIVTDLSLVKIGKRYRRLLRAACGGSRM